MSRERENGGRPVDFSYNNKADITEKENSMLHPSYSDLIRIVNSESEQDTPVVNSRFSIVMATAKRARQIVAGEAYVSAKDAAKPLSTAVKELADGSITILPEEEEEETQAEAVQEETEEGTEK